MYINIIMFVCVREMSQGDVSFTLTKHMFDRKNPNNNHFFWGGGGGGGVNILMSTSL